MIENILFWWSNARKTILHEKCSYSEFFCSVFSNIWTEYGEILRISPYSVQMLENTDQKNSEYEQFLRSAPQFFCLRFFDFCIIIFVSKYGIVGFVLTRCLTNEREYQGKKMRIFPCGFCYLKPEPYSEPCQTSKVELSAKIVNGFQPLFSQNAAPYMFDFAPTNLWSSRFHQSNQWQVNKLAT